MMSHSEICPVCKGRGNVPSGFYLAVGVNSWTTTSTSPETCRSCGGAGYIIIPDDGPSSFGSYNLGFRSCPSCPYVSNEVLTSNPPQYRCTLDNSTHFGSEICTKNLLDPEVNNG